MDRRVAPRHDGVDLLSRSCGAADVARALPRRLLFQHSAPDREPRVLQPPAKS
jgi:hypothetical protein